MRSAIICFLFAGAAVLCAADKSLPLEEVSNDTVDITGHLILGKDNVAQALGVASLPKAAENLVLVKVTFRPVVDKPVPVNIDDFTLLSNKDGQRSLAFEPTEVAGDSELVLKQITSKQGGLLAEAGVPQWGSMAGVGATPAAVNVGSKMVTKKDAQDESFVNVLKRQILPEKPTTNPVTGFLYFEIDGKVKPKDLTMIYKGQGDKLEMRFAP
jgi:hypothetical protein